MMGSLSEEDDQFFDTREDVSSVSDSGSDCPDNSDFDYRVVNSYRPNFGYEVWIKNPISIYERRNKFLKWMGLSVDQSESEDSAKISCGEVEVETDRMIDHSGAVLRSSTFDDRFSSSQSSISCLSNDAGESLDGALEENFLCRIRNLDDGTEFIVDELGQDGMFGRLREVGSNRLLTVDEFERSLGLSPLVQQAMRKDVKEAGSLHDSRRRVKKGWLRRLGAVACIVDRQLESGTVISNDSLAGTSPRKQAVRVRSYKKRSKEFSALYIRQDIKAHEGSILTMKFSADGQFLSSAGEDAIVRVWQVVETERSEVFDIHDMDSSFMYFTVNNLSKIVPLHRDKINKKGKSNSARTIPDSSCVIFPQKVFSIMERPIHEFSGHSGEVLDLSWSKNKFILSSSVDKTVRLWQVGCDQCLKVFYHSNYVTCVQFNPVDDDSFISGSIDGKVRIWAISGCQVVDWTDINEIVTAVCYRPDGKGIIVGSIAGNCRFYDASDNRLQLYTQLCLQGKKAQSKRITGFQFSPTDPSKLMVSSADSQVKIFSGVDVICKFRGVRNTGSQISASFTSDGMHVVSASEDSNVYMWNYVNQDGPVHKVKNIWSCEHFFSNNVSVAIPWSRTTCGNSTLSSIAATSQISKQSVNLWRCSEERGAQQFECGESSEQNLPFSSPDNFSLSHGLLSETLPKGSATWPEEKLPCPHSLHVLPAMCKSQYKFLKTSCQGMLSSPHAWGLVIVTGGWDGHIRSFQNYGFPVRL